jgi:hypothetical protein
MYLYVFLVVGIFLLYADLTGRLTVSQRRVRWWRWIGVAAAAGPGLAPLLGALTGRLTVAWPFYLIAIGYLLAFGAFALGALLPNRPGSLLLRRSGYAALLLLAALPSWALLLLTPFVAIAGVGLARQEAPASQRPDRSQPARPHLPTR